MPLKILSYSELYGGWTMDKVVAEVGKKGNCTSSPSTEPFTDSVVPHA